MRKELQAIKDAFDPGDPETKNRKATLKGRDHARELADKFVKANSSLFSKFEDMKLADCVKAVDVFRAAGMEEDQWLVETWLLHAYEPQKIGGEYHPQLRMVGNGS